jgi:hypothetical protein
LYFLNWANSGTSGYSYPSNNGAGNLVRFAYTGAHAAVAPGFRAKPGELRGGLFAATPGAVFRLPPGAARADFYSLNGERLWTLRRADLGDAAVRVPDAVRGVVWVRLHAR